jgi:hypothetical protein
VVRVSFYSGNIDGLEGSIPVLLRNVVYKASWRDDRGVAHYVDFRVPPRVPLISPNWKA